MRRFITFAAICANRHKDSRTKRDKPRRRVVTSSLTFSRNLETARPRADATRASRLQQNVGGQILSGERSPNRLADRATDWTSTVVDRRYRIAADTPKGFASRQPPLQYQFPKGSPFVGGTYRGRSPSVKPNTKN
jgi:hypothetical protein